MRKLKPHHTVKIMLAVIWRFWPFPSPPAVDPQGFERRHADQRPTPNVTRLQDKLSTMAALKANPDIKVSETEATGAAIQ